MALLAAPDTYHPLPESSIRILTLLPGNEGAGIQCTLSVIPLSSKSTSYEALSYMWGPPEPTNTIELDGHPFLVRENLAAALSVLRHRYRPRKLWIDAICINQNSLSERSTQVAIMSTIYRLAKTVLIWLGESDEETTKLFAILSRTKGDLLQAYRLYQDYSPVSRQPPGAWFSHRGMAFPELRNCIEVFCRRPYWRRVWILQEILSASSAELLCGELSLPLKNFVDGVKSIEQIGRSGGYSEPRGSPGWYIAREYRNRAEGYHLRDLLALCKLCGSECFDSRDKIYGVLSLAKYAYGIVPDYSKSALEVYLEVLKGTGSSHNNYSSTTFFQDLSEELLEPYAKHNLEHYFVLPEPEMRPKALDTATPDKSFNIHLSGVIIDTAQENPEEHTNEQVAENILSEHRSVLLVPSGDRSGHACCIGAPENEYKGCLTSLFIKQHARGSKDVDIKAHLKKRISSLWIEDITNTPNQQGKLLHASEWDANLRRMTDSPVFGNMDMWEGKGRKFLAVNGALGIGPPNTQTGDILCHVEWSKDDFWVIRHSDLDNSFRMLGPAVVLDRKPKS